MSLIKESVIRYRDHELGIGLPHSSEPMELETTQSEVQSQGAERFASICLPCGVREVI